MESRDKEQSSQTQSQQQTTREGQTNTREPSPGQTGSGNPLDYRNLEEQPIEEETTQTEEQSTNPLDYRNLEEDFEQETGETETSDELQEGDAVKSRTGATKGKEGKVEGFTKDGKVRVRFQDNKLHQYKPESLEKQTPAREELKSEQKVTESTTRTAPTEKEVNQEYEETITSIEEDNQRVSKSGEVYDYSRSGEEAHSLMAYLSRAYKRIKDGLVNKRKDIDNELNEEYLDVLYPDKFLPGTEIELVAEDNDNATVYNKKKEKTTWGKLKQTMDPSEQYKEVPIAVKSDGKIIGYLHTLSWISPENVIEEAIEENRDKLDKIRKHVSENGSFATTVHNKGKGVLFDTRNVENTEERFGSVEERLSDPKLKIGIFRGKRQKESKVIRDRDNSFNNVELHPDAKVRQKFTYALIPMANGTIYPVPLIQYKHGQTELGQQLVNSASKLVQAAYNTHYDQATEEDNKVARNLGVDISKENAFDMNVENSLINYLKSIFYRIGKQQGYAFDFARQKRDLGENYTHEDALLDFGLRSLGKDAGMTPSVAWTDGRTAMDFIDFNKEYSGDQLNTKLRAFEQAALKTYSEVDANSLNNPNKELKYLTDDSGNWNSLNYYDYVKRSTKTPLISKEMEDGTHIYAIQPKIEMDFSDILDQESPFKSDEEIEQSGSTVVSSTEQQPDQQQTEQQDEITEEDIENLEDDEDLFPMPKEVYEETEQRASEYFVRGVNFTGQEKVISILHRNFIKDLFEGSLDLDETFTGQDIKQSKSFKRFKQKIQQELDKAKKVKNPSQKIQNRINKFSTLLEQWEALENKAGRRVASSLGIKRIISNEVEQEDLSEKNTWELDSYQIDPKSSLSREVKLFLSNTRRLIKDSNGNIAPETFYEEEMLEDFNKVYKILRSLTEGMLPDYNLILGKLRQHVDSYPFLEDVIERLESSNVKDINKIRSQFVTAMTGHRVNSKMAMWKQNDDGTYELYMVDADSTAIAEVIREEWGRNLKRSAVTEIDSDGRYYIPEKKSKQIVDELAKIEEEKDNKKLLKRSKNWMKHFGIELNDNTWNDIINGRFRYQGKKLNLDGFVDGPMNYLKNSLKKGDVYLEEEGNPLKQTIVRKLSYHDASYSREHIPNSHFQGNKSIYSYSANFFAINQVNDLLGNHSHNSEKAVRIANSVYGQHSMWIDQLLADQNGNLNTKGSFYNNFEISTVSLESLKEMFTSSRDNREITNLTRGEMDMVALTFLQASQSDRSGNGERIIHLL